MSKKYKLKIWYPTLPIWFEVGFEVIKNNELCCYSNPKYKMRQLSIDEVEYSGKFWELIKEKPLFTTEDKVEIFNGDNYWFVVKSDLEIVKAWIPRLHICDWDYSGEHKKPPLGHVQFSTEKAAKDWIHLNKPQYSMQDIFNAKSDESKFPNHFGIDFSKLKPFNI